MRRGSGNITARSESTEKRKLTKHVRRSHRSSRRHNIDLLVGINRAVEVVQHVAQGREEARLVVAVAELSARQAAVPENSIKTHCFCTSGPLICMQSSAFSKDLVVKLALPVNAQRRSHTRTFMCIAPRPDTPRHSQTLAVA